ncbi:uncharacterized protein LOC116555065 [Sapajus apella]|uniref:Uncharacterized protein LOC116555065 n=1 Tax=Sapajus apella TaxID=9515 RepID=A0A6J3IA49_SAPAP|nr:uncharacterized protein LOC116555065 [Sapajus apella]
MMMVQIEEESEEEGKGRSGLGQAPPGARSRGNPGAQGGPGAVRRRRRWGIKPLATCRAAPACAAVPGPPCLCPRARSPRLCRLCRRVRLLPGAEPCKPRVGPRRADMGCQAKARWAAAALGVAGLLCAVLGAVMIVMVPSLIKQQVLKDPRVWTHGTKP